MKIKLSKMNCQYGAPMGRPNVLPENRNITAKLHLQKMCIHQGYDDGGAYWGENTCGKIGDMYVAVGDMEDIGAVIFIRAVTRRDAKIQIWAKLPNVKFYR